MLPLSLEIGRMNGTEGKPCCGDQVEVPAHKTQRDYYIPAREAGTSAHGVKIWHKAWHWEVAAAVNLSHGSWVWQTPLRGSTD